MKTVQLSIQEGKNRHLITVKAGSNLRQVLLEHGFSPYSRYTSKLNCGGRGLCATCGVWISTEHITPRHWHDRLAERYGYARLSCQIVIEKDMHIVLDTEKLIWGSRRK
jgi:ferredoxin